MRSINCLRYPTKVVPERTLCLDRIQKQNEVDTIYPSYSIPSGLVFSQPIYVFLDPSQNGVKTDHSGIIQISGFCVLSRVLCSNVRVA